MIFNILIFVLILGLLIFVHELGHFLVAKRAGMKVTEFAFGYPPRLFCKKYHNTKYCLNILPIGGYVKIEGAEEDSDDKNAFNKKPIRWRMATLLAGVAMNLFLAIIVLAIGFMIGMVPPVSDYRDLAGSAQPFVVIASVNKDSAAAEAGLKAGERIIAINETAVSASDEIIGLIKELKNQTAVLTIGDILAKETRQQSVRLGSEESPLGAYLADSALVKLPFFSALKASLKETFLAIWLVLVFLGKFLAQLFTTGTLSEQVAGPVGIYHVTTQAITLGLSFVLQLIGVLSINLAILNVIPFPALDGGRALFISLEKIFGKRVIHEKAENIIHLVGFVLLIILFLAVTYKDIVRIS